MTELYAGMLVVGTLVLLLGLLAADGPDEGGHPERHPEHGLREETARFSQYAALVGSNPPGH